MMILLVICIFAGSLGGLLQGMVGVGTGVIVIPLLTLLLPMYGIGSDTAIHVALATSMVAIMVTSIFAGHTHHLSQNIRWDIVKKIMVGSLMGSGLGALVASYLPARILEVICVLFVFYTAYRMVQRKKITEPVVPRPLTLVELSLVGLLIGASASILGIGGGLFMTPFLRARGLEMRYAVGIATIVSLPIAAVGALTYIITGLIHSQHQPIIVGYLDWPAFLVIALIAIIAASCGTMLSKSITPLVLQ